VILSGANFLNATAVRFNRANAIFDVALLLLANFSPFRRLLIGGHFDDPFGPEIS
jgi:hypothetical protein